MFWHESPLGRLSSYERALAQVRYTEPGRVSVLRHFSKENWLAPRSGATLARVRSKCTAHLSYCLARGSKDSFDAGSSVMK